MTFNDENAGVAFALVFAAGGATAIGASVVFFPSLAKLASRRTLAASLGLAAGVMTYVSMVDIYGKAIDGFSDAGHTEEKAFIYTTLCFFLGIVIMMVLHRVVGLLMGKHYEPHEDPHSTTACESDKMTCRANKVDTVQPGRPCCADDPVEELNEVQRMADKVANGETRDNDTASEDCSGDEEENVVSKEDSGGLMNMGAATALAIALHNFPEGLVTFVAYMDDPAVGTVLAVGIAIHNIPEGLCVAMPIYYATGNRWKAFFWGILSGVSEPIGALIGYLVLKSSFSGNTYGILFGIVGGIMTLIAIDELLPTAHRYDPKNTVVTHFFILGMLAIAGSLMLFSV